MVRRFCRHETSLLPIRVTDGQTVQPLSMELPLGHEMIHQRDKVRVVRRLEQVRHFMHHDVFEALLWLLRQLSIEANRKRARIAASPLSLHTLHEEACHVHPHECFPFDDQRRRDLLELVAIPRVYQSLLSPLVGGWANSEQHAIVR